MKREGQIFSVDIVIAVGIFLVILITSIWTIDYSREKIYLSEKRNDMELIARNVLSILIEKEGKPSNWSAMSPSEFNSTNVDSIGLATGNSINGYDTMWNSNPGGGNKNGSWQLDINKVSMFASMNDTKYNHTYKKLLGIIGVGYEFEINISIWNGSGYQLNYTIGVSPKNASNIINIQRFAMINRSWSRFDLRLWEKCEGMTCK
jgi:hypothetical protein